jgi:K+-transporting ATPase ATPase A chain
LIDAIQLLFVIGILGSAILAGWRLSPYIVRVFARAPGRLDRVLNPIENGIYRVTGVNPGHRMGWKEYFFAALLVNIVQMAIAFIILTYQKILPFATNTNLQHYNGEYVLSYFSQMSAIQFLQFTSAATGICVAIAFTRGLTSGSKDMGNFYVDFVRSITRILIPLCLVASVVLVWLGIPQTISGYVSATTVEGLVNGASEIIRIGPVASLVSIMQLGTNGGGYYGANSANPFQNPSPATDIFEIFLMLLLPTTLCFVYGQVLGKKRETRPLLWGAYLLFAIDLVIGLIPNTVLGAGIETRFGGFFSAFWTVVTTAVTTGSVNSSLGGMHALTILAAFMGMLIQSTPGGKGVGLMYMVMYIIITVFIVGLMSGRTPEYLGIKITSRDVKLVMIAFLIHPIVILIPTLLAFATGAAAAIGVGTNASGFTQIFYEFTSAAANNGSDFLGASANTVFFNVATAVVMFLGRYAPIGILVALSGSMIGRKRGDEVGLKTDSPIFTVVLVASILILVVLTFFPFLALGPILSYFQGA